MYIFSATRSVVSLASKGAGKRAIRGPSSPPGRCAVPAISPPVLTNPPSCIIIMPPLGIVMAKCCGVPPRTCSGRIYPRAKAPGVYHGGEGGCLTDDIHGVGGQNIFRWSAFVRIRYEHTTFDQTSGTLPFIWFALGAFRCSEEDGGGLGGAIASSRRMSPARAVVATPKTR